MTASTQFGCIILPSLCPQVQDRLNSFLEKSHPLRPRPPRAEEVQPKPIMRNLDLVNTVRRPQTSSLFRFVRNDSGRLYIIMQTSDVVFV